MKAKFLVTGGAGFIGSNIVAELARRGEQVRVLDDLSTGRMENLKDCIGSIEYIDGDIRDIRTVREAVAGCDYVLHQAALPSVPRSVEDPLTSNSVNIDGSLNVLDCARHEKVKKVVFASSSSVYGDSEELPKHEEMTPNPLSPYAVTKLTLEHYLRVYWRVYGLPTVSLRYFNIFGPRQDPNSDYSAVIPKFIKSLSTGEKPIVYGDGLQSRDFTYVSHAVEANITAATNLSIVGQEYNVASGGQWTVNDLLDKLREILKVTTEAEYQDARPGDIKHSY
ncbi:MAG: SDR family oxidoreductase, partial [Candidatus Zixiibacteriota bacterium]